MRLFRNSSARWDVEGGALVSLNTFMAPQEISKVRPPPPVMLLNVGSNKSDSSLSCIGPNALSGDSALPLGDCGHVGLVEA